MNKHTANWAGRQAAADSLTCDPELATHNTVKLPSHFVTFPGFPPRIKLLYMVLLTYQAEGAPWPGITQLAEECRLPSGTIRRTLVDLEKAGLIILDSSSAKNPVVTAVHAVPANLAGLEGGR